MTTDVKGSSNNNIRPKSFRKTRGGQVIVDSKHPFAISDSEIEHMFEIYKPHHNVGKVHFKERTLNGFDKVGLFRETKTEKIVGFTGLKFGVFPNPSTNKKVNTVYGGQMFVVKDYRGSSFIHNFVMKEIFLFKLSHPFRKLIAWGDCISHKSYILTQNAFPDFYPHPDKKIPPEEKRLIDYLGNKHYPGLYNQENGTIHKKEKRMKDHVIKLTEKDLENKYLKFFVTRNPGYFKGHGLLCYWPATFKNFLGILRHLFKRKMRKRKARYMAQRKNSSS